MIVKEIKINLDYLVWEYLICFLKRPSNNLLYGSLISAVFEKKCLLKTYVDSFTFLNEDIVRPTPIKLGDVTTMKNYI